MKPFYRPAFEKQATGSHLQWTNCAAASGAMLADQATLGITDPEPDRVRALTGDFVGGLTMGAVGTAMERLDIPVTVFDNDDHLRWPTLQRMLRRGRFAVVAGDYDVLPHSLRGDKDYEDYHAVFYWRQTSFQVVGDPLNDGRAPGIHKGWIRWPIEVAYAYVRRFDQQTSGGIHAVVMDQPQRVKPRSQIAGAEVRLHPKKDGFLLGVLRDPKLLITGGTVEGEEIRGSKRWFKVWFPPANKVGYIHTSVAYRA